MTLKACGAGPNYISIYAAKIMDFMSMLLYVGSYGAAQMVIEKYEKPRRGLGRLVIEKAVDPMPPAPAPATEAIQRGANMKRPQPHAVAPAPTRQPTRHG